MCVHEICVYHEKRRFIIHIKSEFKANNNKKVEQYEEHLHITTKFGAIKISTICSKRVTTIYNY